MNPTGKLIAAVAFAALYFGLVVEYLPRDWWGFVLSSIVFLTAVYPAYRVTNAGDDRTFLLRGSAFVALAALAHLLKPFLSETFIRYSVVGILIVSIGGALLVQFGRNRV